MKHSTAKLMSGKTAAELLDMYFLDARMHLLETAAILDRLDRAAGATKVRRDKRLANLLAGARLLADGRPERAERFQRLFSEK
jgi:hypothetical protein